MKLTKEAIADLKVEPGKNERRVFDDDLPAFGIRLRATGGRTWFIQYRNAAGKSQYKPLGPVKKLSLARARELAKIDLAKVTLNGDPQKEKKLERDRAAQTFDSVTPGFLDHQRAHTKPQSLAQIELHIDEHWAPFAKKSIHAISSFDVSEQLGKIAAERGPIAANRARATLSSFFGWAMGEGLAAHNPVIGTAKRAKESPRDRVLTDAELVAIWKASKDGDYGRIVQLLILTGQRRDEVGAMSRSEISIPDRKWNLPSARTKNSNPHEVPLSDMALGVIEAALKVEGREERETIFGEGGKGFAGWSKSKAALDERIAKSADNDESKKKKKKKDEEEETKSAGWRLHDIRRTVATRMADLGVLPHVIEAVLNHISGHKGGIAGVYNRASYAAEKREALNTWATRVAALTTDNVIALRA
jgi:integrase